MASLSLEHIDKTYPNGFKAVKDFKHIWISPLLLFSAKR